MPSSDPKALTVAGGKFTPIESIMKDPARKSELQNLIDEAVNAKLKIAEQQANIKGLRDAARESLGLNPKLFSSYVAASFNNDYTARKISLEEQVTMLDFILGEQGLIDHTNE